MGSIEVVRNLFDGIGFFAYQAAQSLDRALRSDLQELRLFYAERNKSEELAFAVVELQPFLGEINGNFFNKLLGGSIKTIDLWIMSRLLFDFSAVIKGGNHSGENLGCLRYCLIVNSMKFMNKSKTRRKGKILPDCLNFYNRNDIVGKGVEIEYFLGQHWADS
ncbi:hypothetical protein [Janthinobacterium fluminis]|uniref:Uncharacterized protein n=1 Tax=Janthinobacterium fluminis TaxID=2987524 RepID=A0ABT5JV31_9BURK|nr:hypothetical protein [Janthinobacterium fluminis]MDC8756040.1 hypothetical protein [Janthinobacterium fluminis]